VKNKKSEAARPDPAPQPAFGPAFLLAQIGSHAAGRFSERIAKLHLTPAHSGILHILAATPGLTQQALAGILGMVPSRLVGLLDELDALDLTERRRSEDDRRRHALTLTEKGRQMLAAIGEISREHQRALLAALTDHERATLHDLLQRVADEQKLTRNVHPGYRMLGVHRRSGT
jgi:DNA-binding MarR family transcriptional regulator